MFSQVVDVYPDKEWLSYYYFKRIVVVKTRWFNLFTTKKIVNNIFTKEHQLDKVYRLRKKYGLYPFDFYYGNA